MKKFAFAVSLVSSIAYIIIFCFNVSDLAATHLDENFSIPFFATLFSILVAVVLLIVNKFKQVDRLSFAIPALFFISSVITMIIGYFTPCPLCS